MCLQFYEGGHTQLLDEQIINISSQMLCTLCLMLCLPALITWKYSASEMIINHVLTDAVYTLAAVLLKPSK